MSIKRKINIFVALIVLLPVLALLAASHYVYEQQRQQNMQHYLSVIMTLAQEIATERSETIRESVTILGASPSFRTALQEKDAVTLSELLRRYEETLPFVDAVLAVDVENHLVGKSRLESKYVPDTIMSQAAAHAMREREGWFSEEVLPLEELFAKSSPVYDRLLVRIQGTSPAEDPYLRKALTEVSVIPVFDRVRGEKVIGAVIVLDALNNDKWLLDQFGSRIDEVFLAISIDGIRILSNIITGEQENYIGSRSPQESEVTAVREGLRFGRQYFPASQEMHVFLDKDIKNSAQDAVATIGVGIPESRFSMIITSQFKWVLAVAAVIMLFMLVAGNRLAATFSRPIEAIIHSVRRYGEVELQNGAFSRSQDKDEIAALADTFHQLVDKMGKKELERKKYMKALRISKENASQLAEELKKNNSRLEFMVNERTGHLQLAIEELKKVDVAKSNFMANISHELRTPLNAILGAAELLQEGIWGKLTEKQHRYVHNIDDSARHLLQLINDVLDISKLATGKTLLKPEPFYIKEVIQQAVSGISAMAAEKNILIETEIVPEDFRVTADLHKFLEILYNILSNAVKFTRDHGRIDILVHKGETTFDVAVRDTGIGIAPEDQERVFREFEQVDSSYSRQYEGTGLGLPIVDKLVKLHGGSVRLRSQLGIGTELFFIMPLDTETYLNGQKQEA